MIKRRSFIAGAGASLVAACSGQAYTGPEVTRIQVFKGQRMMQLLHNDRQLAAFKCALGFNPVGHKTTEGDGRTPEGAYRIDRRNPNSLYHLSLGLSYPNALDVEQARKRGVSPGGDIFIHGTPSSFMEKGDWTWGCIAVENHEMDAIFRMVGVGTPIYIYA